MTNPIDIGIINYGRLLFLQQSIQAIRERTKTPHKLYVANNFCSDEPEIENYLLECVQKHILDGIVLVRGNIYSNAIDLLYKYFLKSDPFVVTDGDVIPPRVDYCWLEYNSMVLRSDSRWAYLTVRPSLDNVGKDDSEIEIKVGRKISRSQLLKDYRTFDSHPEFNKIGLNHFTGVFLQTFNRPFYLRYLKKYGRFRWDHMIWRYAKRRRWLFGSLLDDCIHLGWQTIDFYPHYVNAKNDMGYSDYIDCYNHIYIGVGYRVIDQTGLCFVGNT